MQVKSLKAKPQADSKKVLQDVETAVSTMNEAADNLSRAFVDIDASDVLPGSSVSGSTGIAELHPESG